MASNIILMPLEPFDFHFRGEDEKPRTPKQAELSKKRTRLYVEEKIAECEQMMLQYEQDAVEATDLDPDGVCYIYRQMLYYRDYANALATWKHILENGFKEKAA